MRQSIATRLTIGFVVTLASVLTIAGLALSSLPRLRGVVTLFQDHLLRELAIMEDIRVLIADAVSQDHAYILSNGEDVYDLAFERNIEEITRLLQAHDVLHARAAGTLPDPGGIADLHDTVDHLAATHDLVEELVVAGRLEDARRLSQREGTAAAAAALAAVRTVVRSERRAVDAAAATVSTDTEQIHRVILIVSLLAAGIGGATAFSVIRSVTVPVRRLVDVTRRVDRGRLDVRARLAGGDEIGELAQSFDRMIDRLEAAFAEQERFLADISHELRTPITIVRGNLEILKRRARDADQTAQALAISLDELDRMGRLVNELLLLVRATRPDFLAPQVVSLAEFLPDVLRKAEAIAPRPWRLGAIPQTTVVADRDRLTQALLNLLRNAAEHTQPAQPIELAAATHSEWVDISVKDHGDGIPEDLAPHIFERFRRGHSTEGHTGLGLSIVQAIIRAHGGEVFVDSRPGAGSTFTIRLPVSR